MIVLLKHSPGSYVSSHPKDLILGDLSGGITTALSLMNTCEHTTGPLSRKTPPK